MLSLWPPLNLREDPDQNMPMWRDKEEEKGSMSCQVRVRLVRVAAKLELTITQCKTLEAFNYNPKQTNKEIKSQDIKLPV